MLITKFKGITLREYKNKDFPVPGSYSVAISGIQLFHVDKDGVESAVSREELDEYITYLKRGVTERALVKNITGYITR